MNRSRRQSTPRFWRSNKRGPGARIPGCRRRWVRSLSGRLRVPLSASPTAGDQRQCQQSGQCHSRFGRPASPAGRRPPSPSGPQLRIRRTTQGSQRRDSRYFRRNQCRALAHSCIRTDRSPPHHSLSGYRRQPPRHAGNAGDPSSTGAARSRLLTSRFRASDLDPAFSRSSGTGAWAGRRGHIRRE